MSEDVVPANGRRRREATPDDRPATGSGSSVRRFRTRIRTFLYEVGWDLTGRTTTPRTNRRHLEEAIRWLYRSQDATGTRGSAATYNLVLGWGGPYPETTGYIVPTLYDYADWDDSSTARDRAEAMADWLLTTQLGDGGFPAGEDPGPEPDPSVFNTGQIIFGLLRAHEETGDDRFVEAARRAGEWLVSVQHDGGYWDRYDYRDTVHSYSSRVAWALLETHAATGVESFRSAARDNLRWVVDQQRENGWFERCGFGRDVDPFLHTIAYTIRGLLEGALLLRDETLLVRARRSADALLDLQTRSGILTGQYDEQFEGPDFYCLTGNAQMAVVWYRLFEATGESSYRRVADETVEFLKRHHRIDGSPEVRGGLKGSTPVWQRYMYLRYPNWAAKFLADALLLAEMLHDY